jgi:hypothetical protein
MNDNLAIFLLMIVAIGAAVALTAVTAWIRATHRGGGEPATTGGTIGTVERLTSENDQLKDEVSRLEARVQVLEPLAADPALRNEQAIEALR